MKLLANSAAPRLCIAIAKHLGLFHLLRQIDLSQRVGAMAAQQSPPAASLP